MNIAEAVDGMYYVDPVIDHGRQGRLSFFVNRPYLMTPARMNARRVLKADATNLLVKMGIRGHIGRIDSKWQDMIEDELTEVINWQVVLAGPIPVPSKWLMTTITPGMYVNNVWTLRVHRDVITALRREIEGEIDAQLVRFAYGLKLPTRSAMIDWVKRHTHSREGDNVILKRNLTECSRSARDDDHRTNTNPAEEAG